MLRFLKKDTIFALILLSVLLAISFYDVVFLGKTFKVTNSNSQALPSGAYGQELNKSPFIPVNGTDASVLEETVFEFIKRNLWRGILPLWNPHQAGGYPLIGMLQVGMFYPLTFLIYLFPEWLSWDVMIFVRILCAGLFAFWFMRTLRFSKLPALATAIAFMLSGPMLLLQYWTANVDIMLPLILLSLEKLINKPKPGHLALLALCIALSILGGHPEHIFLVNFSAFCFFVFRLYCLRKKTRVMKVIGCYTAGYLFAFGLTAFVTFPFFSNLLFNFWHGHPESVGIRLEENPARAVTLLLPHFFQKAPITYQWVFAGWWGGYLGLLPFAFAFLSLFSRQRKGLNFFFAAAALLIISKEYSLPFVNWIGYLPIFRICRFTMHTPVLAAFCIAVLCGMGIRTVISGRKLFLKGLAFSLIIFIIVNSCLFLYRSKDHFQLSLKAALFALCLLLIFLIILYLRDRKTFPPLFLAICLTILLSTELFLYIHRERPKRFFSFGKVPYMEFLQSTRPRARSYGNFWAFYPNTASGFEVDDLGYFFGMVPKRFVHFVNTLIVPNHFLADLRPPALRAIPIKGAEHILNLLNVKYIIHPKTQDFARRFPHFPKMGPETPLVYKDEVRIYERPTAYPRVFTVNKAIFENDEKRGLLMLKQLKDKSRFVVIIKSRPIPSIVKELKDAPVAEQSLAYIKKYTANVVEVEAVMKNAGFLILSDAYHPGWKAYDNGNETPVYLADSFVRAVFLPPGRHSVEFVFAPATFAVGVRTSLFSLFVLLLLFIVPRILLTYKSREKGKKSAGWLAG